MGMFDEILVELELPDGTYDPSIVYQTKDLDNLLYKYVLTSDGQLYRDEWDWDWVEDPDAILKGYLVKIEGSYRREYLTELHCDIRFYRGMFESTNTRIWRDYIARFSYGKLDRITYKDTEY